MTEFIAYGPVKPDPTLRMCYDCRHMKGAMNLWCTNSEAIKARMTSLPGVSQCDFWAPMKWQERAPGLWQKLTAGNVIFVRLENRD